MNQKQKKKKRTRKPQKKCTKLLKNVPNLTLNTPPHFEVYTLVQRKKKTKFKNNFKTLKYCSTTQLHLSCIHQRPKIASRSSTLVVKNRLNMSSLNKIQSKLSLDQYKILTGQCFSLILSCV